MAYATRQEPFPPDIAQHHVAAFMYSFDEIKQFAIPWFQRHLAAATAPERSDRRSALDTIAETCWRWLAPGIRERLPDESSLVTEYLLHALFALDPRQGVDTALELWHRNVEPHSTVARVFLAGLPDRIPKQVDVDELFADLWVERLPEFGPNDPQLLDRLGYRDHIVRVAALKLFRISSNRADKTWLERLFSCLGDKSPAVLSECLEAIAQIAPDRAESAGKSAFQRAGGVLCRQAAADFLVRLGRVGRDFLLEQDTEEHSFVVARALARWEPREALDVFKVWIVDADRIRRNAAVNMMYELVATELRWPSEQSAYRIAQCQTECIHVLGDPYGNVRESALVVLAESGWPRWQERARDMLSDPSDVVRFQAFGLLDEKGADIDPAIPRNLVRDSASHVRERVAAFFRRTRPASASPLALQLLTRAVPELAESALDAIDGHVTHSELLETSLRELRRIRDESGATLLEVIQENASDHREEAIETALKSRCYPAQAKAAEIICTHASESDVPRIRQILSCRAVKARLMALAALKRLDLENAKFWAAPLLEDKDWRVRRDAVAALAQETDPLLVDDLLPLALDNDNDVREVVLRVLAKYDDVRVLSELISSLNDTRENVSNEAQKILMGEYGPVPVLERLQQTHGPRFWESMRTTVDLINRWASRVGQELLGRPVTVTNYRQGIGRTPVGRKKRPVTIEVNDSPVTSGHPFGEQIMQGIALHEIGHHVCDIGVPGHSATRGIARSEGIGDIYDILCDERLERVLRSRRPEWGVSFDRLASYVFAQQANEIPLDDYAQLVEHSPDECRQAVERGDLPGEYVPPRDWEPVAKVILRRTDMLQIPGLVPLHGGFLMCLRCGFDPRLHPNRKVARAVALVPKDLKDLNHGQLLEVARAIGKVLGNSDKFKRDMRSLRLRLRKHRVALAPLSQALERMAEAGQLPEWMQREAQGIRANRDEESSNEEDAAPRLKIPGGKGLNLGKELSFDRLEREETLQFDGTAHQALVSQIRKHVRRMRTYFERLGTQTVDEYASRRGRRLDLAQVRNVLLRRDPNLLVHTHDEIGPDAYIGILIDRSGSMGGEKMRRAKAFGALLAESAQGLLGIEGHVNAFDDDTFYWMGALRHNAIAALEAGGGNNDAGGLQRAADLALASRKRHKLLIMISDGSPTECTFESLKNLVQRLTRDHEIVCAQVAVERIEQIAFPHYVDLSRYTLDEAVARFGNLLIQLTREWR